MKELVVISGKGGTGKTSLVGSFAALARENAVLADCDVDAADLHLILKPTVVSRETFIGGKKARIKPGHCTACGKCEELCRFDAIHYDGPGNGRVDRTFRIDTPACEGCGVCTHFCDERAIEFADAVSGDWFVSETRFGPMVHAKLVPGAENSGKLVSLVRTHAKQLAEEQQRELVLIDGSPGTGCPVVASITGADTVLIVTEPTRSALHDFDRVADLTRYFGVDAFVCVNKWDLSPELAARIDRRARERGVGLAGRIRYDTGVTMAQIRAKTTVEYQTNGAATDIRNVWGNVAARMEQTKTTLPVISG